MMKTEFLESFEGLDSCLGLKSFEPNANKILNGSFNTKQQRDEPWFDIHFFQV